MATADRWKVEFTSGIPVYRQIVHFVCSGIGRGSLRPGDRLPTIRELTETLGINPNTVAKAYRELDLRGMITSRRGDGSFIAAAPTGHASHTRQEKTEKLDELLGRLIAEANAFEITRQELVKYINERMNDDE